MRIRVSGNADECHETIERLRVVFRILEIETPYYDRWHYPDMHFQLTVSPLPPVEPGPGESGGATTLQSTPWTKPPTAG